MVINKSIYMNMPMKELTQKVSTKQISQKTICFIESKINDVLSSLKLNDYGNQKWLSIQDDHSTYDEIICQHQTLTNYEWDSFEIYFNGKVVNNRYEKFIDCIINCFESLIKKYFSQEAFCLIMSVQEGRLSNITVRFHLLREREFYIDKHLDNYQQPVLYVLFDKT